MKTRKTTSTIEYGDFQTPQSLSIEVSILLKELGHSPASVLEPNCGMGSFITASLETFSSLEKIIGIDINQEYTKKLSEKFRHNSKVDVFVSNFFKTDWDTLIQKLPSPLLILGNPPWVTNSELSSIGSKNLPEKGNHKKRSGMDAITGSSNFDISEWILIKVFEWARYKNATVAMLIKTTVARKVLLNEWKNHPNVGKAKIFGIDALSSFGVSVDACLLVYDFTGRGKKECEVYKSLSLASRTTCFGYEDKQLVADINSYKKTKVFQNTVKNINFIWRSGIKHDAAKVMELQRTPKGYINKLEENIDIEDTFVFPMMKSSDIANDRTVHRYMLVPQRSVGEETKPIRLLAPKTWNYLMQHRAFFDKRKSSIYKNKPLFSIFGVGNYSFALWKVAISGLYKTLRFQIVPPHEGKPVMLDDTCYFLPCNNEQEANMIAYLLNTQTSTDFFSSFIFWDSKRPITAKLLNKFNITEFARHLQNDENIASSQQYQTLSLKPEQLRLLEQRAEYR